MNSATLFGVILCMFSYSCEKRACTVTRIEVLSKSPVKIIDEVGITDSSSFFVSFYQDYVLYELPYHVTKEVNNILVYDSIKYEYFFYKKNEELGFLVKNKDAPFIFNIKKDSILQRRAYAEKIQSEDILKGLNIITRKEVLLTEGVLLHKYIVENNSCDSIYFFYDKDLNNIKYSLSEKLDSANESKLFKIQIFLKKDSSKGNAMKLNDFFINSFEIKVKPVPEEIEFLFKRCIGERL